MNDPSQRSGVKGKSTSGTNHNNTVLSKSKAAVVQLTIIIDFISVCLYAFFSKGDEVTCGSGITSNVCYLDGVSWLGYVMAVAFCFTVISMMLMGKE